MTTTKLFLVPSFSKLRYKKSQLIAELQYLLPQQSIKSKDVVTTRKKGNGTVVSITINNKVYSTKAQVPGKAYLSLLQLIRKDYRHV